MVFFRFHWDRDLTDKIRPVSFCTYLLHLPYLPSSLFKSLYSPLPVHLSLSLPILFYCSLFLLLFLPLPLALSLHSLSVSFVLSFASFSPRLVSGRRRSGWCSVSTQGSNESVIHGTGGSLGTGLDVLCLTAPSGPQLFYLHSGQPTTRALQLCLNCVWGPVLLANNVLCHSWSIWFGL